jgi:hypothetical protein
MFFWKVVHAAKGHVTSAVNHVAAGTCWRDVAPRWTIAVYVSEVNNDLLHALAGSFYRNIYRYEFQGAGAKGNKPHVHAAMTLAAERTD